MSNVAMGASVMTGAESMFQLSGRWGLGARLCILILFGSFSLAALAEDPESPVLTTSGERPSLNGEPTQVEIGLYVIDVDEIDDVNQRFSVDMFIAARWHDDRLALPAAMRKGQKRLLPVDTVWTPRVLFLNDRGLTPQLRQLLEVDDLGNVEYQNRLSGELAANLEFEEFPFDVQRLPIDIVSYANTTDEMQFSIDSQVVADTAKFSIEGWKLTAPKPEVGVFVSPADGVSLPRLTYVIEASRDSQYYLLTMLVPMALIIFMAWTVFWLQPNIVPPRIAISTASIFSLIALGVSIRLGLPKVSYLTRADVFVLGCTLMVFLALGVAVIGSRWASSDRIEKALKANAIARWLYMILFIVVAYVAFRH
jgi:hypothetical protein